MKHPSGAVQVGPPRLFYGSFQGKLADLRECVTNEVRDHGSVGLRSPAQRAGSLIGISCRLIIDR